MTPFILRTGVLEAFTVTPCILCVQEYVKVVMKDGRMQGAVLIGDTGLGILFKASFYFNFPSFDFYRIYIPHPNFSPHFLGKFPQTVKSINLSSLTKPEPKLKNFSVELDVNTI